MCGAAMLCYTVCASATWHHLYTVTPVKCTTVNRRANVTCSHIISPVSPERLHLVPPAVSAPMSPEVTPYHLHLCHLVLTMADPLTYSVRPAVSVYSATCCGEYDSDTWTLCNQPAITILTTLTQYMPSNARILYYSTMFSTRATLSATSRLLLPALDIGTVYLVTSGLPCHSQHFVKSWKLIYFGNLTQTLFYNCIAIVVLEVTFT